MPTRELIVLSEGFLNLFYRSFFVFCIPKATNLELERIPSEHY